MRERAGRPTDEDLAGAIRWANDPARHDPAPQSFERILDWLLDGIAGTLGPVSGPA